MYLYDDDLFFLLKCDIFDNFTIIIIFPSEAHLKEFPVKLYFDGPI